MNASPESIRWDISHHHEADKIICPSQGWFKHASAQKSHFSCAWVNQQTGLRATLHLPQGLELWGRPKMLSVRWQLQINLANIVVKNLHNSWQMGGTHTMRFRNQLGSFSGFSKLTQHKHTYCVSGHLGWVWGQPSSNNQITVKRKSVLLLARLELDSKTWCHGWNHLGTQCRTWKNQIPQWKVGSAHVWPRGRWSREDRHKDRDPEMGRG